MARASVLSGALVLVLVLAGCGSSSHSHKRHAAPAEPVAHVRFQRQPRQTPALRQLRATLERLLGQAGPASGAEVYDLPAGTQLVAIRAKVKRPPASVEKLYTTVAVLDKLGPNARLHTRVLSTGHLGPGGVWHGNLFLRGGGDPTFGDGSFNSTWEQGYGPTAGQLVSQLTRLGIHRVAGQVIGDQSLFDSLPGGPATYYWPDVPDYGGQLSALTYDHGSTANGLSPAGFAAHELALALRASGVQVTASPNHGRAPHGARVLASVSSPPMSVLTQLMDVPSDDLFADLLAKQLGVRFNKTGSISAGARVIQQVIASYGIHPKILDGSGLDRADHSSPSEVVGLLKTVWRTPVGGYLWNSLPLVGATGTVKTVANGTPAQGNCVAKTGTLDNVTNLAGYCHSAGHHIVAFALFIDGPENWQALQILANMAAAIARY